MTSTIVIRVGTKDWSWRHAIILNALLEGKRELLDSLSGMHFDHMLNEFQKQDSSIRVGRFNAYILYGRDPLFITDDGQVAADVRGLVFKPSVRVSKKKNIIVEIAPPA